MQKSSESFCALMDRVRDCRLCEFALPHTPRPVLAASEHADIVIIGQAPGLIAHNTNTPWNDKSGDRLRHWLGIEHNTFYNPQRIALIPMGFCFPGYKNGADAPPRKECAPTWHNTLLSRINPQLTILVGRYAQQYYCKQYKTLTEAVKNQPVSGTLAVLPHPSGRNNRWLGRHPWFEASILPALRAQITHILRETSACPLEN